jgi:hypothetical protein
MSLTLEYVLEMNATPDAIWRVFEQIEQWPRWDAEALKSVRWVNGTPWTRGARFEMQITKPVAFTLTPEIVEVAPPVYVRLKGSGKGVHGEQHYIFRWNPERSATEVRTLQEFSGMALAFAGHRAKQQLLDGIAHMFGKIKQEAEAAQPPTVEPLLPPEARAHELPEHEIPPRDLTPDVPGPSVQGGGTDTTQASHAQENAPPTASPEGTAGSSSNSPDTHS